MLKNKKGITLIALVITIVVLLVLVGVVVNLSLGENGIIGKAKTAVDKYKQASQNEQEMLAKIEDYIVGNNRDIEVTDVFVNSLIEKLEQKGIQVGVPTGTIISYMGNNVPNGGYLKCDGTVYNISDYPKLATQIETEFESKNHFGGDGETTFAVPDLRGEFLRGTGTNSHLNQGSGDVVGRHQDGTSHANNMFDIKTGASCVPYNGGSGSDWIISSNFDKVLQRGSGSAWSNKSDNGGGETVAKYTSRPTNTSVLYCIKY